MRPGPLELGTSGFAGTALFGSPQHMSGTSACPSLARDLSGPGTLLISSPGT